MTVFGSTCTRIHIHRTLICNAILHHFQVTLSHDRIERICILLTLFLLSRPFEQLEFIRSSNLVAEVIFVQPIPKRLILPSNFQSRYRRHLFNSKSLFELTHSRGSLHQRSRFTIHFKQKLHFVSIQLKSKMWLKQISSLFTITSHTSPSPILLFCARVVASEDFSSTSRRAR